MVSFLKVVKQIWRGEADQQQAISHCKTRKLISPEFGPEQAQTLSPFSVPRGPHPLSTRLRGGFQERAGGRRRPPQGGP